MAGLIPLTREDYSIGWICAIDIELAAALAVLDEREPESPFGRVPGDPNIYHFGRIGDHKVVIACLPAGRIGTTPAIVVATYMLQSFPNIRSGFGLMVGVGGGAPNLMRDCDIRLGDIVVSQPNGPYPSVVQYDFGKAMEDGNFVQTGLLNAPPTILLCALSAVKAMEPATLGKKIEEIARVTGEGDSRLRHPQTPDRLFKANYRHFTSTIPGTKTYLNTGNSNVCGSCDFSRTVKRPDREFRHPHIHYGTIASANQVMKDGIKRDNISARTGALCFEMEAAGLTNDFPCLVIRGICDYSDGHKNKLWQPYAALVAAIYARILLCFIPTVKSDSESVYGREAVKDVIRWLAADSSQEEYDSRTSDKLDGTCEWIFQKKEYQEWKKLSIMPGVPNARCLWIYGKAGMGKSVLAANIIRDLKRSDLVPCVFYFAMHESVVKGDPLSVLRSWVSQLTATNARAFEKLRSMREGNEDRNITEIELWVLFETCLTVVSPCFLVVDGYDETVNDIIPRRSHIEGAREVFLQKLIRCLKGTHARLAITSRDVVDIRRVLMEFSSTIPVLTTAIEIRPEDTSNDLQRYCYHIVNERFKSTNFDKKAIAEGLCSRSEGMFLWARLSGARLFPGKTVDEMLEDLAEPVCLNDAYERDLARIRSLQPPRDRIRALRILNWVLFAARPLSVREIAEGLCTTVPGRAVQQLPNPGGKMDEDYINYQILRLTGSLIEFRKARDGWDNEYAGVSSVPSRRDVDSGTLHLAHFSVKEFLLDQVRLEEFGECAAHEELASACISYLLSDVGARYVYTEAETYPNCDAIRPSKIAESLACSMKNETSFMRYASEEWIIHAREYEILRKEPLPLMVKILEKQNIRKLKILMFFSAYFLRTDARDLYFWLELTLGLPALVLMSKLGLKEAVRHLLNRSDANLLLEDIKIGLRAIRAASEPYEIGLLEILLEYYPIEKIQVLDEFNKLELDLIQSWFPTYGSPIGLIELFIRYGLDREEFVVKFHGAFSLEASGVGVFFWLLQNGADFNSTRLVGGELALQMFIRFGYDTYPLIGILTLLDRGYCLDCPITPPAIEDYEYLDLKEYRDQPTFCYSIEGTKFYFAWTDDTVGSARSHCPKGCHSSDPATLDINEDGDYCLQYYPGTPLQIAAWYGRQDIVSLLIDRGADPNYSGGFLAQDKNEEGRTIFFARNGTAAELASRQGHKNIVKILERASLRRNPDLILF